MPPDVDRLLANARWVKALGVRLVGDDAAADDLTQETLLRALERPPRDASTPRSLRGWLKRVVARFALQRRRHDDAALARERAVSPSEAQPDVADVVAHAELHRRIVDAVLELDEPYRATILLRFFEDEPPRRIAERMAVPLQTVHTRLRRGIERLRARFDVERRSGGELHSWAAAAPLALAPTFAGRLAREVVIMSGRTRAVIAASILAGVSLVVWRAWPRAERRAASDAPTVAATPVAPATDGSPGVAATGANRSAESIAGGRERSLSEINEIVFSGSIAVTGRVVDASAAPIACAELELSLPDDSSHVGGVEDVVDEEIRAHGFWDAPCAPPRSKTTSDASGRFTLGGLRTGLPYTLTIAATGYRTESRSVPNGSWGWPTCLGAADAVRLPDVVLTRGCDLTVHVVGAGGLDAGGVAIYSDRWPGTLNLLWTGAHSLRGTTNSRGVLTLPPPRSDAIWIVARAPDGREANVVAVPAVPESSADGKVSPIELELADGEELDVHVLDGDGHPLAGLRVTVRSPAGSTGTLVDREAETDDDGHVHFRGLPPGEREAYAGAPGGMPELAVGSTRLSKIAAGTKDVELRLPLAHPPIPVRFVDASDGSPVRATALLVVDGEVDGPESGRNLAGRDVPTRGVASIAADATRGVLLLSPARSHPTGEDRFPREMQSDRFRVVVDARDHARTWLGPFDPKELSTGEPLKLAIERGRFVSGSVVDGQGSPIPGARVHEIGPGPGRACNMFTWQVPAAIRAARADATGAFTLGPLANGSHALLVDATGFIATTAHVSVAAEAPAPIRIVLGRGATVEGDVFVEPDEEPTSSYVVLDRRGAPVPDLGTLTTAPDEAGHFEFSSLPPGDYAILALLPPAPGDENFRTVIRLLGKEETPVAPQVVRFSLSDEKKTFSLDPWREGKTRQRLDTTVIDPARPGANEALLLYLDRSGLPHRDTVALSGGRLAAELPDAKSILVLFSELVPAADLNGRAGTRSWYVGNAVLSAEDLERGVAPIKVRRGTLRLHVSSAGGATIDEGATLLVGFFVDPGFSRSFPELLMGNTRTLALAGAGTVTLSDLPTGRTWLYARDAAGNGRGEVYVNVVENETTDVELDWK